MKKLAIGDYVTTRSCTPFTAKVRTFLAEGAYVSIDMYGVFPLEEVRLATSEETEKAKKAGL